MLTKKIQLKPSGQSHHSNRIFTNFRYPIEDREANKSSQNRCKSLTDTTYEVHVKI